MSDAQSSEPARGQTLPLNDNSRLRRRQKLVIQCRAPDGPISWPLFSGYTLFFLYHSQAPMTGALGQKSSAAIHESSKAYTIYCKMQTGTRDGHAVMNTEPDHPRPESARVNIRQIYTMQPHPHLPACRLSAAVSV